MRIAKTTGLLLVTGVILGGCASYDAHYRYLLGRDVNGEAVQYNNAVHIVDPTPEAAENTDIPVSGERAAGAVQRYNEGSVEEPEEVSIAN